MNGAKLHIWNLFIIIRFSGRKSQVSFHDAILLEKPHSFYAPQRYQHCKTYTPGTQLKPLQILQPY